MSDAKIMRELVREAARAPVPEVDWNRVEQRLFEKIEREPAPRRMQRSASWKPIVAIAAAAAGIAAAISFGSTGSPLATHASSRNAAAPAQQIPSRLASGVVNASTLHEGDRLVADTSLTVQHPGHASWVLRDASIARIERLGEVIVIDLEAGAVRVEVEPRPLAESFVVRVGDTAVSVHGTIFTVEKRGERALVQVLRGSVAVGPRSRRSQAMGWLMVAPSSASFVTSGAGEPEFQAFLTSALESWQQPLATTDPQAAQTGPGQQAPATAMGEPVRTPGAQGTRPQNAAPVAAAQNQALPESEPETDPAGPSVSIPDSLNEASARTALDSLRARIADCHRRLGAVGGDGVKVVVQSKLTIMVAADGHVTTGRFDPPLAPEVQSCAGSALLSTAFPNTRNASTLVLQLRF